MTSPQIIDVHQHSGPWPFCAESGGIELNLRLNARRGITAAVISSARAVVQDMTAGNAELACDLAGHESLYGYVTLNPNWRTASEREVERYSANPRFIGFKLHSTYAGCPISDPRVTALLDLVAPLHKPVLLHTWGASEVLALRCQAERHPDLPMVMAHAGADAWRLAITAAAACPNLYLDFASSTPYNGAVQRAVDALGPEKVIFGSDSTLFDPLYMLAQFDRLVLDEPARAGNVRQRAAYL